MKEDKRPNHQENSTNPSIEVIPSLPGRNDLGRDHVGQQLDGLPVPWLVTSGWKATMNME